MVKTLRSAENFSEFSESICPLQGPKSRKLGREGSRVKTPPFPATPEKGALSQKIPFQNSLKKWF